MILRKDKLELIDRAKLKGAKTFLELGGIGDVEGGYSFYALSNDCQVTMVDKNMTDFIRNKKKIMNLTRLTLIEGRFHEVIEKIKPVDCILLFYILLHQVNPDWNKILEMYAPKTKMFAIFDPRYTGKETVRLMNLPNYHDYTSLKNDSLDRDNIDVWQWGITDDDLISKMKELDFRLHFFENRGLFPNTKMMENHSFLFIKK